MFSVKPVLSSSFWSPPPPLSPLPQVYYVYGFMLLVALILMIVTASVTIVGTYFLLNAENYHWQWTSFGGWRGRGCDLPCPYETGACGSGSMDLLWWVEGSRA